MKITELNWSRYREFLDMLRGMDVQRGVEIGVYKGKYTEIIMSKMPDLELYAVDAFKVYGKYKDYEVTDLETEALKQTQERADKCGFKIIQAWSLDAAKQFEDESLDFMFLDANHDFVHVAEDLNAWTPKIKKGGIVAGHDFFDSVQERYGVKYVVPAWCEHKRVPELFVMKGDRIPSWYYVK